MSKAKTDLIETKIVPGRSMDEIDNESFNAGPSPLDSGATAVTLTVGGTDHAEGPAVLSLDGEWEMAEEGDAGQRLKSNWDDAIAATVPGSVHTALWKAGKIPDPYVGKQDASARENSYKTWWFKREFERPAGTKNERLVFDGVAIRCTVWLNGHELGMHEGMFGGPSFDIGEYLQNDNVLVVRIEPAPGEGPHVQDNQAWRTTVVFNNVYGWHYSSIPSLGIWRSVRIEGEPAVRIRDPFIAAKDAQAGGIDLAVELEGPAAGWSGRLSGTIEPENFDGEPFSFEHEVKSADAISDIHLRFTIPEPRLWWPVDMGEPSLYRMKLSFTPDTGGQADAAETTFGIRTVEMAPLPGGPRPEKFNWTFVINGKPMFVKGTGWCTMDPLMDFSRERYDRLVTLARDQHVQMLRCWGSGMPETDEFYDLCDRAGVMVLQEWPTAWNSHEDQPYDMLEETVRLNTLRLRSHPSLVMWGGGNESGDPFGKAIDMMGRLSIELDGTRQFHRGEAWGGSMHNYHCYWGRRPLDNNLNMTSDFFGEFGLACMPVYESVQRYLPDDEKDLWPAPEDGSFAYHTPIFNTAQDMSRLRQYAQYFVREDCSMEQFTVASQLSQAVGIRHTLERARTRWPECTGALYYKMNDNYPAASWACVDWYGAPKIGHYIFQDAFAPLHACVIFSTVNTTWLLQELPVFLLDDADALKDAQWQVVVCAYDRELKEIKKEEFSGNNTVKSPLELGRLTLSGEEAGNMPLLVVAEVLKNGKLADRTFYWANYEPVKGSLFNLPKTGLSLSAGEGKVTVTNEGDLPAVAVNISCPGHLHTFRVSDNYFWLDAGESKSVEVNETQGLEVSAWNSSRRAHTRGY